MFFSTALGITSVAGLPIALEQVLLAGLNPNCVWLWLPFSFHCKCCGRMRQIGPQVWPRPHLNAINTRLLTLLSTHIWNMIIARA